MKVKVIKKFRDITTKEIRKVGEEFECTAERYDQIKNAGEYVEPVDGEPENGEPENGEPENGEPENGEHNTGSGTVCDIAQMSIDELKSVAKEKKIKNYSRMTKEELVDALSE
jgi:hypothetical protein